MAEMRADARQLAARIRNPGERAEWLEDVELLIRGDDETAWRNKRQAAHPWERRPGILRAAILRWKRGNRQGGMRGQVAYVAKQQTPPDVAPGSEAAAVAADPRREIPGRGRGHEPGAEQAGLTLLSVHPGNPKASGTGAAARASPPDRAAQVRSWEQAHPEERRRLRRAAARQIVRGARGRKIPKSVLRTAHEAAYEELVLREIELKATSRKPGRKAQGG